MAINQTEGKHAAEFLINTLPGDMSRDTVTLISGQNLGAGRVLGKITASGKYTALAPAASDGSQTAAAILERDCDASGGDAKAIAIVNWAEVNSSELDWGSLTSGQITTAIGQLKAATIRVLGAI